jgi:isopenicillin-N N-acyltransferase like protein
MGYTSPDDSRGFERGFRVKRFLSVVGAISLLTITWGVRVYHLGVFPMPEVHPKPGASSLWIPKSELGIHQLVLSGDPYSRGVEAGKHTHHLIERQERELIQQLNQFFPSQWIRRPLEILAMRWFWGIDRYFEPWTTQEMYGVSQATSEEFNYLGDRLTRQVAYHGLHEVGQLMVDQGSEDMGCTVAAIPVGESWVVGRNFDFEGGRIFDSEKIMKWVFPDDGYAFVSVIWAGMVGAVTGVNEHGLYLSLNAAGSRDFKRLGTPSTLVLLKALQYAKNADEAVSILRKEQMFITDIFVLLDSKAGKLFRIEKSPEATEVIPLELPSIVTNHLISERWKEDPINRFRSVELTSLSRSARGEFLLSELSDLEKSDPKQAERAALRILRDKGEADGKPLHLGNRRAIDALIATHAVVFNAKESILHVSQGPGVSGPLLAFDLKASFRDRKPRMVEGRGLPRDPLVSDSLFSSTKSTIKRVSRLETLVGKKKCDEAGELLAELKQQEWKGSPYHEALGDFEDRCGKNTEAARVSWAQALELVPAYPRQARRLQEKVNGK